jgi:hypothetical protein
MNSDLFLWILILAYAFYALLFVPFFSSKSLTKYGGSEKFWFIIVALLNVYVLLYLMVRSKYRNQLIKKEKILLVVFMVGYFFFLAPILLWMNNV